MIYSVRMGYLDEVPGEATELPDEQILAQSLRHPSIFAKLVDKYEAAFLRKAMSIVHDQEEAEDIVQEAFAKIYMYAPKFKPVEGASFSSWAYRIVVNTSLTHYMKRKKEKGGRAELEPEILELLPDKDMRQFEKHEITDEVASVLTKMPEPLARALASFLIEGKSQEQIAKEEGASVGAIKTRVHRAKQEFKKIYNLINNKTI
jgi:RNA polymerase sigma-70 factor, ECF subfamily